MTHKVRWHVGLSNGENYTEGNAPFDEIKGELSPFLRLDKYLLDNKLEIKSLCLIAEDGRTFNLPSAGNNPKFQYFKELDKPIDYWVERVMNRELHVSGGKVAGETPLGLFTIAVAIYPDYELQIWVDENNTKNSWSVVKCRR